MKIIDPAHPFYRPLWRRIAITAVVALWLLFELLVTQNAFFIVIVAGLLAHTAWILLISWKDDPPP